MKKPFLILSTCFLLLSFSRFAPFQEGRTATVPFDEKYELYIYWDCQPTDQYTILGSLNKGLSMTGSYGETKGALINKAKKKYPDMDAIMIQPKGMGGAIGIAIKFND